MSIVTVSRITFFSVLQISFLYRLRLHILPHIRFAYPRFQNRVRRRYGILLDVLRGFTYGFVSTNRNHKSFNTIQGKDNEGKTEKVGTMISYYILQEIRIIIGFRLIPQIVCAIYLCIIFPYRLIMRLFYRYVKKYQVQ